MKSFNKNQCYKVLTTKGRYTHTHLFEANYPLERHDVTIIFCGRQIRGKKKGQNLYQRGLRDRGTQT